MFAPIAVGLVILALISLGIPTIGGTFVLIVGGSAVLAYLAWLATTYRRPADPDRILPAYLLLIAAELVHMGEEYFADFPGEFDELFSVPIDFNRQKFTLALMVGVNALALLAAFGLRRRNPIANYVVWFYTVGPGLINAVAHIAFPIIAESRTSRAWSRWLFLRLRESLCFSS